MSKWSSFTLELLELSLELLELSMELLELSSVFLIPTESEWEY
jgi:hypothetical protein